MPRYAAIDIGSNSLRMQVAEVAEGQPLKVLAADREVTRIGSSVFRDGVVSEETVTFVAKVLSRFAETFSRYDVAAVRAVATSAVRDASNQAEFIARTSKALGVPVEIISGAEEARLIHLGVHARWPQTGKRVLIVDVGGGSAEIIVTDNGHMVEGVSRPLGAVRLTEVFMRTDPPAEQDLAHMMQFIDEKLAPAVARIGRHRFDRAIVTSASAAAVVCAINRVPRSRREEADRLRATLPQVRRLYKELSSRTVAERRKVPGLGPRRAEIIVPGAAVFLRAMEVFELPAIRYSIAGVRDGVVADLHERGAGRQVTRLSREQTQVVERMARKYAVPVKHARQVAALAHALFEALYALHKLPPENGRLLEAAAYLHDIGHYVSDTGHHKHSLYLVLNSELPGFTDRERLLIALLCRYHRKTMPAARHLPFQSLNAETKRTLMMLTPLLRIADALDSAKEQHVRGLRCALRDGSVEVALEADADPDIELWAAERAGAAFRSVYERNVVFTRSEA